MLFTGEGVQSPELLCHILDAQVLWTHQLSIARSLLDKILHTISTPFLFAGVTFYLQEFKKQFVIQPSTDKLEKIDYKSYKVWFRENQNSELVYNHETLIT